MASPSGFFIGKCCDEDKYPSRPCTESRRLVQGGQEGWRRSPRSGPPNTVSGHGWPRYWPLSGPGMPGATRVVPQRCAPLSLEGDKGAFCLGGVRCEMSPVRTGDGSWQAIWESSASMESPGKKAPADTSQGRSLCVSRQLSHCLDLQSVPEDLGILLTFSGNPFSESRIPGP